MTTLGMTKKMAECLSFIERYIGEKGYSPSYGEIAAAVRLRSKSGATGLVQSLIERGHIRKGRRGLARTIELAPRLERRSPLAVTVVLSEATYRRLAGLAQINRETIGATAADVIVAGLDATAPETATHAEGAAA